VTINGQTETQEPEIASGELVALDTATGAVKWAHKFSAPAFGAATVVNDLVFATTFNGTVYALKAATGDVVWQVELAAGTNTGVAIDGNTMIAPAGAAQAQGQTPELMAYRLGSAGGEQQTP
ncbi:MAG TPA: PQQ-binding-like beta-propeller repeat protein, partial [Solirubrobacteraceae bacterium]|nr:PQQ-binding-like beta-propeller repeat protein [Solirubrobacteraceae bacterium]